MNFPVNWFGLLFITIVWIIPNYLVAEFGGWGKLAAKYRSNNSFLGSWKGWQWGKVGSIYYKHALWIGIAPEGLYLKTGPLFVLLFHPALLIPWTAIKSIEESKFWWTRTLEIRLNDSDVQIMVKPQSLDEAQRFLGDKMKLLETKASI